MRAALSTTRAPILSRLFLRVANSAQASGILRGTASRRARHQPVGRGVQDEAELVGDRALAGGPVGGELALVQLDEVLGLAAGAVDIFIEMAGVSAERGDDVAGVEAARGCLQPGDDPAFAVPRTGGVVEGGEAPHLFGAGLSIGFEV